MSSLRKKLFGLILVAMLVGTIVFWGSVFGGGGCIVALTLSVRVFLFNKYASSDLAKTFEEDGEHVKGWRV